MRREYLIYAAAAIAAILLLSSSSGLFENDQPSNQAADFTLSDTEGNQVILSDLQGRVVVLNFMATWCGGCRAEIPNLVEIDAQYSDDEVVILSVSAEDPSTLESFKESYSAGWTFLVDDGSVFSEYEISVIPNNFILDPSGQIVYHEVGAISAEELREQIERAR